MEKTIIMLISLVFVSLSCLSQDIVEVGGKKIKPVTEFNLIKLDLKINELSGLLDQAKCKKIFNLVPRQGVEIYRSSSTFAAKEKGGVYDLKKNSKSIGYFFENFDSEEKIRDLISWSYFNNGRILNSSELYLKIVEELMKIKPEWVIEPKSLFNGFEIEKLNDKYYLAKYLYYGSSENRSTIEAIKCLVDKTGHITLIENRIVIRGPVDISVVRPEASYSFVPDEETQLFRNAILKAINSFGPLAESPKTDKSKRVFYYVYNLDPFYDWPDLEP